MNQWVAVILGIVVIAGLIWLGVALPRKNQAAGGDQPNKTSESSGLQKTDVKVGDGAEAAAGKKVTVSYVGTLQNGTTFDSNENFSFNLGEGKVIQGWDQGVAGMKVGGERKLVIPPSLGYGSQAVGSIPANSTLLFDIKLLNVE